MKKALKTTSFAAALALLGLPALAQITPEQVVASLEGQGYTNVTVIDEGEDDTVLVANATRSDGTDVVVTYNRGTGEVVSATGAGGQIADEAAEAGEATPAPETAPAATQTAPAAPTGN